MTMHQSSGSLHVVRVPTDSRTVTSLSHLHYRLACRAISGLVKCLIAGGPGITQSVTEALRLSHPRLHRYRAPCKAPSLRPVSGLCSPRDGITHSGMHFCLLGPHVADWSRRIRIQERLCSRAGAGWSDQDIVHPLQSLLVPGILWNQRKGPCTMTFASTAGVPANRKFKYYRISDCPDPRAPRHLQRKTLSLAGPPSCHHVGTVHLEFQDDDAPGCCMAPRQPAYRWSS